MSQSRGAQATAHPFANAVCKRGAIIVSHGSSRCRFWLCSPTVGYHGRCRCSICDAVDPEIGSFQVHFVADKSFKGMLSETVGQGSHWVFTGPLACATSLFCIFSVFLECCIHTLANLEGEKGTGGGSTGAERNVAPHLVCCVTCLFFNPVPLSLSARKEFCSTKVHCKKSV